MSSSIRMQNVSMAFNVRERSCNTKTASQAFVALRNINLDVRAGEFVVLVGPSGCGKSTLLDLLSGLVTPTAGRILIDDKPITGPALDRSIVFQQYALLPWRTALGNVEFGLEARGLPKKERSDRARRFLAMVGLTRFENRHPHELSGGMKQRVAIARSLAYDPGLLLMDEPFAALDAQTREILQTELLRIWEQSGKTIIFITHSIDEAVYLGQRVAIMTSRPGRIKKILTIPPDVRAGGDDPRSAPEFARLRHEIWAELHDEVAQAEELERTGALYPAAASA